MTAVFVAAVIQAIEVQIAEFVLAEFIASQLVSLAVSAALGFVKDAVFGKPKPKLPNLNSFEAIAQNRTQQVRQAITPWRLVYGEVLISGPMTFVESTNNNKMLHLILTLAAHPITGFKEFLLGTDRILPEQLDANGLVTSGKWANKVRIQTTLGSTGVAYPSLASATLNWTADHRQANRASVYVRFEHDDDLFPGRIPPVAAWVKGKKVVDPRAASAVIWSPNPALIIRDYMLASTVEGGMGATTAEFNDIFVNSAANSCEEIVSTANTSATRHQITEISTSANELIVSGLANKLQTGDRCIVSTNSTQVGGVSTGQAYYAIIKSFAASTVKCQLASTYALALSESSVVNLTGSTGTSRVMLKKTGEPRYTANGVIEIDKRPSDIITDLLTALGGRMVYAGGQWHTYAAVYTAPTVNLSEDHARSGLRIQTQFGRRERFNAVKGIYVSPQNQGQPTDYPAITNATYETQDNGERTFSELDLPYTTRPNTAQRLAKIQLERHRQAITVTAPMNLHALQLQAGDTVGLSNSRMGWSTKVFEVTNFKFAMDQQGDVPLLGVDLNLRETASGVFDWNSGEETQVDLAPNTNLPDAGVVLPPTLLLITEVLFSSKNGGGIKSRAVTTWTASTDAFVQFYEVEFKLSTDSDWTMLPIQGVSTTTVNINDIVPETYDFRVRAVNSVGVHSVYVTKLAQEIQGLAAAPSALTGVTINAIGGFALIRWDVSTDLDVKQGGRILFRHSPSLTGATIPTSVTIGKSVGGDTDFALLPLKEGSYLVIAEDSSSIQSNPTIVTSKQASLISFTTASTLTDSPSFLGSHQGTIAISDIMTLTGSDNMDDWGLVDSVVDWDIGEAGVQASGVYFHAAGFDFGSVVVKRLTTAIKVKVVNVIDLIDGRTDNIDSWADFDGATSGEADARVKARHTDSDPATASAGAWSPYELLESAEFSARGFEFVTELTTSNNSFNIRVSTLTVTAETPQ